MIAVDTSAIMAILLNEPNAAACIAALEAEADIIISAGTVAETLIVAAQREVEAEAVRLLDGLGLEIVSVTVKTARRVAEIYASWGKGVHPGGLNFGDCFAYEVAKARDCALLFVGEDFSRTDIQPALAA
jgi:ribonuclease VapC